MTTTETTPATCLADELADLADHLRTHPELGVVNVTRGLGWQISTYDVAGEPGGPAAVLAWARTLEGAHVLLATHGDDKVRLTATGHLAGRAVHVWDVTGRDEFCAHLDPGDVPLDGDPRTLTVDQLAAALGGEDQ